MFEDKRKELKDRIYFLEVVLEKLGSVLERRHILVCDMIVNMIREKNPELANKILSKTTDMNKEAFEILKDEYPDIEFQVYDSDKIPTHVSTDTLQ